MLVCNAFRQAINCIFKEVYQPLIRKSRYVRSVRQWTEVTVKVSYAVNHNDQFPNDDIPKK